ncbi:hypothetical protein JOM56_009320 [Amanita muscaria]
MKGPASALRSAIHAKDEEENADQDGGYTILVFDNVRSSSTPVGGRIRRLRCLNTGSTKYVGWTEDRDLHVVSVSLEGMIAQELAYRIPNRIVSLILAVTTPGGYPSTKVDKKAGGIPPQMDEGKSRDDDPQWRTKFEVEVEEFVHRVSVTRKQQFMGHVSQMAAGLTHAVQPEPLRHIFQSIQKVAIVTGDEDNLIHLSNAYRLKEAMSEAELAQFCIRCQCRNSRE